jgi:DNA-binding CsgD family transcriptional regulator
MSVKSGGDRDGEIEGGIVRGGRTKAAALTPAEARVLKLISQSRTNREIAALLCISPATVKRHVENIFRKLGLRNRVEAAIYGLAFAGCRVGDRSDCLLAQWRNHRCAEN